MIESENEWLKQLQGAGDLLAFANLMNEFAKLMSKRPALISARTMRKILHRTDLKYTTFYIDKKNGGKRIIHAPIDELKIIQKRLADFLEACDIIPVYKSPPKRKKEHLIIPINKIWSHGFRKKREYDDQEDKIIIDYSIVSNANVHVDKRYVLNFDIKDFFPSINFGRIQGYFIKIVGVNKDIASIIARIACHNNRLPQGSPCSPIISNLIAHEFLDKKLAQFASDNRCNYSRYADDITFSTNQKEFPDTVAFLDETAIEQAILDGTAWRISNELENIINSRGFEVNHQKTRLQSKKQRQTVTGLVVNSQVNIRKEYYKCTRAMVDSLFRKGYFEIPSNISPVDIENSTPAKAVSDNMKRLDGMINHIYNIKYKNNEKRKLLVEEKKKQKNRNQTAITFFSDTDPIVRLYRSFLYYKNFIFKDEKINAVVICEGSSDIIHIRAAIKQLRENENYPDMKLKFLQKSKLSKEILDLGQGSGNLSLFVKSYHDGCRSLKQKYKNVEFNTPVIIIADNDKGLESLFNFIYPSERDEKNLSNYNDLIKNNDKPCFTLEYRKEEKKNNNENKIVREDRKYYENLYLVKLPHVSHAKDQKETCIEDLHEKKWRKRYKNLLEKMDRKSAKQEFANTIREKYKSVDFLNFKILLNRIDSTIKHHEAKLDLTYE